MYDFCPRTREGAPEHRENYFDDWLDGLPFLTSPYLTFNGACVRLNPDPDFASPPPPDIDATLLVGDETQVSLQPGR
jgi:hypothetical protein